MVGSPSSNAGDWGQLGAVGSEMGKAEIGTDICSSNLLMEKSEGGETAPKRMQERPQACRDQL